MKRIVLCNLFVLFCVGLFAVKPSVRAAVFKSDNNYIISAEGVGKGGTKAIKVTGTGKQLEGAVIQAQMNAVHACIFKGISGNYISDKTPAIYPASEPSSEHQSYFDDFFSPGGKYLSYLIDYSAIKPRANEVNDLGHGYIEVTMRFSVDYARLQKDLIANGIIKGAKIVKAGTAQPKIMVFPSAKWCIDNYYVNSKGDPDYEKAITDSHLRDLIITFEDYLTEHGYDVVKLQPAIDQYRRRQAIRSAEKYGNEISLAMQDRILEICHPDIRVDFAYDLRKDAAYGAQYVHFTIEAFDTYTKKPIYQKALQGSAVKGTSQLTNQMLEAIYSVQDPFFARLTNHFDEMKREGREIIIELERFESCQVKFTKTYEGDRLSDIITDIIEATVVEGQSFDKTLSSADAMKFEQVRIPLFIEKKNRKTGEMTLRAQYAFDYGQRLADEISDITSVPCRVTLYGMGHVVITLGQDASDGDY